MSKCIILNNVLCYNDITRNFVINSVLKVLNIYQTSAFCHEKRQLLCGQEGLILTHETRHTQYIKLTLGINNKTKTGIIAIKLLKNWLPSTLQMRELLIMFRRPQNHICILREYLYFSLFIDCKTRCLQIALVFHRLYIISL